MWNRPGYTIGILGASWLLMAAWAVNDVVFQVQNDLTSRVKKKLFEDALQNWKFQMVGQDVILMGPKPTMGREDHPEEAAAKDSVLGVNGVREVIEVRYPTTTSAQRSNESFWFEIRRSSSEVWLSGDFASPDQKDHAIFPLLEWFGDMNVHDAASLDQRLATPFDPTRAIRVQSWMPRTDIPSFVLRYQGGVVTVEANVASEMVANAIRNRVRAGFGKSKFNDQIKVGGQKPRGQLQIDDLKKYNRPLEKLFVGESLTEEGKAYLSRVAPIFAALPGRVKVGVHVDAAQAEPDAWSERRAKEIREFLVSAGASSSQISAEGFGAKIPNPGGARRRVTFEAVSL